MTSCPVRKGYFDRSLSCRTRDQSCFSEKLLVTLPMLADHPIRDEHSNGETLYCFPLHSWHMAFLTGLFRTAGLPFLKGRPVTFRAEFSFEHGFILRGFVLGGELIRAIDHIIFEMAGGAVDPLRRMNGSGLKILFLSDLLGCMASDTLGFRQVL